MMKGIMLVSVGLLESYTEGVREAPMVFTTLRGAKKFLEFMEWEEYATRSFPLLIPEKSFYEGIYPRWIYGVSTFLPHGELKLLFYKRKHAKKFAELLERGGEIAFVEALFLHEAEAEIAERTEEEEE